MDSRQLLTDGTKGMISFVRLFVCSSVLLFFCPSVLLLSVCLFDFFLSYYLFRLPVFRLLSVRLKSVCLSSVRLFFFNLFVFRLLYFVCSSYIFCLFVCLSVCLFFYLSVRLFVFRTLYWICSAVEKIGFTRPKSWKTFFPSLHLSPFSPPMVFLSNGYSLPNLANWSTRAKLAIFGECEYSPKRPFSEICETRQTRRHSPSRVARTFANIRQTIYRVLARLVDIRQRPFLRKMWLASPNSRK